MMNRILEKYPEYYFAMIINATVCMLIGLSFDKILDIFFYFFTCHVVGFTIIMSHWWYFGRKKVEHR